MRAMSTVAWAAGRGPGWAQALASPYPYPYPYPYPFPGWAQALDLLREMRCSMEKPCSTMAAADFYMMALGACER
jgi:hypothetical protein